MALTQVVEQRERHRPRELFFLDELRAFPRLLRECRSCGGELGIIKSTLDEALYVIENRRTKAPRARTAQADRVDIHDGGRYVCIGIREPRPRREQLARRGNHCVAVVDRAARFIPHQIGIDVGHVECARAFRDEPLPDFVLSEREVTRAGIENQIDAAPRERSARTIRNPRVFANLKADADVTHVEQEVADRVFAPIKVEFGANALGPRLEPTRLVVNPFTRQVLLPDEPNDPPIHDEARGIEQTAVVQDRQTERHDHATRERQQRQQRIHRALLHARRVKGVFAPIARNAQLRETQDRHARLPGARDGLRNPLPVACPIQRSRVQHGSADSYQSHA